MDELLPQNLEFLTQKQQKAVKKRIKRVAPTDDTINSIYTESEMERIAKGIERKQKKAAPKLSKKQQLLKKYDISDKYARDIKLCLKTGLITLTIRDISEDLFKIIFETHVANKMPKDRDPPTVIDGINYHIKATDAEFVKKFIHNQQNDTSASR